MPTRYALERKQEAAVRAIKDEIEDVLVKHCGERQNFALIVFDPRIGANTYVTNTPREVLVTALDQFVISMRQGGLSISGPHDD